MRKHKAETAISDLVGEITTTTVNLSHRPSGPPLFLGRETELAALDAAWAGGGRTHIVQLIAPGGLGKTSLVKRWLDENMKREAWRGSPGVHGWRFYSQGTRMDKQASEDSFFKGGKLRKEVSGEQVRPYRNRPYAAGASWRTGRQTVKVVPTPSWLSTSMRPPWRAMML